LKILCYDARSEKHQIIQFSVFDQAHPPHLSPHTPHTPITNHIYAHTRQKKMVKFKAYKYSPTCMHLAGFEPASKFHKFKEIYFVSLILRSSSASSSTNLCLLSLGVARRVIQKRNLWAVVWLHLAPERNQNGALLLTTLTDIRMS